MPAETKIASESGHWYDREGNPRYTIIGKNGKERATTLRDARKEVLYPSVTTIMKCYPKFALTQWLIRQGIYAALTSPLQKDGETHEQYMDRIYRDAEEQAQKAREKGTDKHRIYELYLSGDVFDLTRSEQEECHRIITLLAFHLEISSYDLVLNSEPEKSFSSPIGYGGKVDLHSRTLNFVCDFKTKEFDENVTKLAWDEHLIQLQAYRNGLGMPQARMLNVFISTSVPGLARIVEHDREDIKGYRKFMATFELWKEMNDYDPATHSPR